MLRLGGGAERVLGSAAFSGDFGHPSGDGLGVGAGFESGPVRGESLVAVGDGLAGLFGLELTP